MAVLKIKDNNGNWVDIPTIQGVQGIQGIPGPKGDPGDVHYSFVQLSTDSTTSLQWLNEPTTYQADITGDTAFALAPTSHTIADGMGIRSFIVIRNTSETSGAAVSFDAAFMGAQPLYMEPGGIVTLALTPIIDGSTQRLLTSIVAVYDKPFEPQSMTFATVGTYTTYVPRGATEMAMFIVGGGSGSPYSYYCEVGKVVSINYLPVDALEELTVTVGKGGQKDQDSVTPVPGDKYHGGDSSVAYKGNTNTAVGGAPKKMRNTNPTNVMNAIDLTDTSLYSQCQDGDITTLPAGSASHESFMAFGLSYWGRPGLVILYFR